jgi:hypothetical protein
VTGRRDCAQHTAGRRIDFLDAVVGQLKQVLAVEGRSRVRGDIDRSDHVSARRIEGAQPVSGGKPDPLTVIRDSAHASDTRKGSVLSNDLSSRLLHGSILVTRQWTGE